MLTGKIKAIFDIRPVKATGEVDFDVILAVSPEVDLRDIKEELTAGSTGKKGLEEKRELSKREVIDRVGIPIESGDNIQYPIANNQSHLSTDRGADILFENLLNLNNDPKAELISLGGVVNESRGAKRLRYRQTIAGNQYSITNNKDKRRENDEYDRIIRQIREPVPSVSNNQSNSNYQGANSNKDSARSSVINDRSVARDNYFRADKGESRDVMRELWGENKKDDRTSSTKTNKKWWIWVLVLVISLGAFLFFRGGINLKNKLIMEGNSALSSLERAEGDLKAFDFLQAAENFSRAYNEFSTASNDINFLGADISSFIAGLPGAGKLKAAINLTEIGKSISEAGRAMSNAIASVSEAGSILDPDSDSSPIRILDSIKSALFISKNNLERTKALLAEINYEYIPEDKQDKFNELKNQIPEFEKMIDGAIGYADFISGFVGINKEKKYLILFQNYSELRPTGGFAGTYGILAFRDGQLDNFFVDDIYNLDGQLKQNYIPPKQLQHITPTWGTRDSAWFIDFPVSARKAMWFYQEITGQKVDGVLTVNPRVITNILDIVGSIEMPDYGLTLNGDNFLATIQEEVEYGDNREQPKQIVKDMAPKLLEKIYSAKPDKWMQIFNILVAGLDNKDILMHFNDLKLRTFAIDNGFAGEIKNVVSDYLMITFSNVKGSKTDLVTDNYAKLETIFENEKIRHRLLITRNHNGSLLGFYNRPNSTYVRILLPRGAVLTDIDGNDKTDFKPLINYNSGIFRTDGDLFALESTFEHNSSTGVDIYEESGKMGIGFWLITDPKEAKSVVIEYEVSYDEGYSVSVNEVEYGLYVQKQPGLRWDNFELSFKGRDIKASSYELNEIGNTHTLSNNLEHDLPIKIILQD